MAEVKTKRLFKSCHHHHRDLSVLVPVVLVLVPVEPRLVPHLALEDRHLLRLTTATTAMVVTSPAVMVLIDMVAFQSRLDIGHRRCHSLLNLSGMVVGHLSIRMNHRHRLHRRPGHRGKAALMAMPQVHTKSTNISANSHRDLELPVPLAPRLTCRCQLHHHKQVAIRRRMHPRLERHMIQLLSFPTFSTCLR